MKYLQYRNSTAIISQDGEVSYEGLYRRICEYSRLIDGAGARGGKIAIYSDNRPEWVYALFGGWNSGSTVVPIDSMSLYDEVAYILDDCRPDVVFTSRRRLPELEQALASSVCEPRILVFEECNIMPEPDSGHVFEPLERSGDDAAMIIYTSGTTGSPKGAVVTFSNIEASVSAVSGESSIFNPRDRVMVLLPIHHIFPLGGTILAPLYAGSCCVFSPSVGSRDLLETLQQHGVTVIVGVPRLYNMLIREIRKKISASFGARALFSLARSAGLPLLSKFIFARVHRQFGGKIRFLISGGAAIEDDVVKDFKALGFNVITGYGMTETTSLISFTRPGAMRIGASGHPCPEIEVRIVDGEIAVKGRHVMKGYYNRPGETSDIIRDGWLYTGDLGHVDSDGFVFVTGRKKEIIVLSNGKNINPEEIESKLLDRFDAVKEVAVCQHDGVLHAVIHPDPDKVIEIITGSAEEYFRKEVIGP
ncbi:MAG: AMP-binding protein, partial [Synergistaceae bacterium]|nr:AMP-binding protein [Synergistaceae bacterium]